MDKQVAFDLGGSNHQRHRSRTQTMFGYLFVFLPQLHCAVTVGVDLNVVVTVHRAKIIHPNDDGGEILHRGSQSFRNGLQFIVDDLVPQRRSKDASGTTRLIFTIQMKVQNKMQQIRVPKFVRSYHREEELGSFACVRVWEKRMSVFQTQLQQLFKFFNM